VNIDQLKSRCVECGDCWVWQGIVSSSNVPKINMRFGDRRTVISTRRVMWEAAKKGPIPAQKLIAVTCGNQKCLNPAHLKLTTKSEVAAKSATYSVRLKRAVCQAGEKSHMAKLKVDQVAEIRASSEPGKVLAARYGVGVSVVNRIRNYRAWRDYSSPFVIVGR
jgi:hypothetical protein